jgi:hypothetical protein
LENRSALCLETEDGMLGWHISVYRQMDGGVSPAMFDSAKGTRLAVWQADWRGLDWLLELAKAGKAIDLGGSGYPCRFTATAESLIPHFIEQPPRANDRWLIGAGDVVTDKWEGRTVIAAAAAQCRSDEWLLVEAWDES